MDKEYRSIKSELRSDEGRHISGYAVRFNEQSRYLGFYETISRGAITQELIDESDVFALLDHDPSKVLARCKRGIGNLVLTVDDEGVKYDFDALENELGNTVLTYVRAGIIDSSSFAFAVDEDGDIWERRADGEVYRTITKIGGLYDVSPVFNPAYDTTSCSCRSYDEFKSKEEKNSALEKKYHQMIQEIEAL